LDVYQIRPMIPPTNPQRNKKTIGKICHTNFVVPVC